MTSIPPAVCLFGASPSTGNLGVSALMHSAVAAVHRHDPDARVLVFDHRRGAGWRNDEIGGVEVGNPTHGALLGRRYWRGDNLSVIETAVRFGLPPNDAARAIRGARVILDVSGGDSFSDIYGAKRFEQVIIPKRMAVRAGTPLVLLPQTYGPYKQPQTKRTARALVAGAAQAWARDPDSYAALLDLLGDEADPAVHREGVDMAFALEVHQPPAGALLDIERWRGEGLTVVGLNISGLTYTDPHAGATFGFALDYRDTVHALLDGFLADPGVAVLLVPHVEKTAESDRIAADALLQRVDERLRSRIAVTPAGLDQCQIKGVIARLDWFAGTRMHSTIAGLSTQTPTATLAYSLKARGVFATCGAADQVADARHLTSAQALELLRASFADRDALRRRLSTTVPPVKERAVGQLRELLTMALGEPARTPTATTAGATAE